MLSAAQLQTYHDNGYLVVEDLIPPATLEQIRSRIAQLTEEASTARGLPSFAQTESTTPGEKAPLRKLNELCPIDPFFREIASSFPISLFNSISLAIPVLNRNASMSSPTFLIVRCIFSNTWR